MENIIVAALAGAYFANRKSAALIACRLEEAFRIHEELASERLKGANHRIEDLEQSAD